MASRRLESGGTWIDRSKPIGFRFDGRSYEGFEGDTLASALLANGVDVDFLQHRKVFQKLFGDFRNADIGDVQFIFADQVQQQVEWTAKDFELDAKVHHYNSGGLRSVAEFLRNSHSIESEKLPNDWTLANTGG